MKDSLSNEVICELLAAIMGYPSPDLPGQVRDCAEALKARHSRAAGAMDRLRRTVEQTPLAELEELYTATFDLRPVCYPYVGFQLFGDTYKRGEFLALLNARCREAGFVVVGDLPDHLGVILRYLAHTPDADLVHEAVLPTLDRMIEQLKDNPYLDLMRAIQAFLREL
jgi:nitrate reductase delta subunit